MKSLIILVFTFSFVVSCSNFKNEVRKSRRPSSVSSFVNSCVGTIQKFFAINNELTPEEIAIRSQLDEVRNIDELKVVHNTLSKLNEKRIRAIIESSELVHALNFDHLDRDLYSQMIRTGTFTPEEFDMLGFPTKRPLNQIKSFRSIGVEIEGLLVDPAHNTYKKTAEKIKEFYDSKKRYASVEKEYTYNLSRVDEYGESARMSFNYYSPENTSLYKVETKYDRNFEVKFDETLAGSPENTYGVEITSPILSRHRDRELFEEFLTKLDDMNIVAFPEKGGIHIHISASDLSVGDYKKLLRKFLADKEELYSRFQPNKGRGLQDVFVKMQLEKLEGHDNNVKINTVDKRIFQNRGPIAYIPRLETIEFRLFNSTTDPERIREMIDFSLDYLDQVDN